VLAATRRRLGERYRGDLDAPEVLVHSVPALGLSMELERHDAAVWKVLRDAAEAMAPRVDAFAIACNTLNHYEAPLRALDLPARLVSVQDVVRRLVRERGLTRIALLGSRPVMELGAWSAYRELPQVTEVEVPADLDALHRVIYDVKARGGREPDIVARFEGLLGTLTAPVALLACTELPLIPVTAAAPELADVTELLAQELAEIGQRPRHTDEA
jgi:aspartate racemase